MPIVLTPPEWQMLEDRYVLGEPTTYAAIAKLRGVSAQSVALHASPRYGDWKRKRKIAQEELRLDAKSRLRKDHDALNDTRELEFEDRFELTSGRMNDLLDMLLDHFVPKPDASEEEIKRCKNEMEMLSPNQKATLIVRCVERLSGVAKTRQLLSGGETERLLIDLRDNADVPLDSKTEALIEEVLKSASAFRSSGGLSGDGY